MPKLCVNIDHVATIRQARMATEPDPVAAVVLVQLAGAAGITAHLREDRRHVNDTDVRRVHEAARVPFNLEMAATDEMVGIATAIRPPMATLVPEKRTEVTTEGGLDVAGDTARIADATARLRAAGIAVSHFIDPEPRQIDAAAAAGAGIVELHTGPYANAPDATARQEQLRVLVEAAARVRAAGLQLNAGHGLTVRNVLPVAAIPEMCELHIGHSIISAAVLVGLERAVGDMLDAIARGAELGRTHPPADILRLFAR